MDNNPNNQDTSQKDNTTNNTDNADNKPKLNDAPNQVLDKVDNTENNQKTDDNQSINDSKKIESKDKTNKTLESKKQIKEDELTKEDRWVILKFKIVAAAVILALLFIAVVLFPYDSRKNFSTDLDLSLCSAIIGTDSVGSLLDLLKADPVTYWALKPGESLDSGPQKIKIEINSQGYRTESAKARSRTSTVYNSPYEEQPFLLVLGDSRLFQGNVLQEDTFCVQFKKLLDAKSRKKWTVYNASVPGFSSMQIKRLASKLIPRYKPDFVIIANPYADIWKCKIDDSFYFSTAWHQTLREVFWCGYLGRKYIQKDGISIFNSLGSGNYSLHRVPPSLVYKELREIAELARTYGACETIYLHMPDRFPRDSSVCGSARCSIHELTPVSPVQAKKTEPNLPSGPLVSAPPYSGKDKAPGILNGPFVNQPEYKLKGPYLNVEPYKVSSGTDPYPKISKPQAYGQEPNDPQANFPKPGVHEFDSTRLKRDYPLLDYDYEFMNAAIEGGVLVDAYDNWYKSTNLANEELFSEDGKLLSAKGNEILAKELVDELYKRNIMPIVNVQY